MSVYAVATSETSERYLTLSLDRERPHGSEDRKASCLMPLARYAPLVFR